MGLGARRRRCHFVAFSRSSALRRCLDDGPAIGSAWGAALLFRSWCRCPTRGFGTRTRRASLAASCAVRPFNTGIVLIHGLRADDVAILVVNHALGRAHVVAQLLKQARLPSGFLNELLEQGDDFTV